MPCQYSSVACTRRPGKRCTELPRLNSNRCCNQDNSDVTVLSKNDWSRIHCHLNKNRLEEERQRAIKAERLALHELSQSTVKNWTNTTLGGREKKLAARRAREEQEERERVELDLEEAKLQAERRREIIDKAKLKFYYETDRVKNFHSGLLYSEVLKERDAQVELNNLRREAERQSDIEWRHKIEQDYLDSISENNAENKLRREKIKHTTDYVLAQIYEKSKNQERELEEYMEEGREIQRDAERYKEEEREKAERRAELARKKSLENQKQMDDTKYMRHIEKLKEEEEDEECRMFAAAKTKMMKMRIQKEREMEEEKIACLERIRDKLVTQQKEDEGNEEERLNKAQDEVEAKKKQIEEEKERKRMEAIKDINEYRLKHMEWKKALEEEEKLHELEMFKARQEAALIYSANEEKKLQKRKEEAIKLSVNHLADMEERRKKLEKEREQDLEQYMRDQELRSRDETVFQDYSRRVIEHSRLRGRNVIPLEKASRPGVIGGGLGPVYPGRGPLKPSC